MNISSLVGFLIAGLVLYLGVIKGANDAMIFLDSHALILVIGGTVAATLISYPIAKITALGNFLFYGVFLKRNTSYVNLINEIRYENSLYQAGHSIGTQQYSHPFLAESLNLLRSKGENAEKLHEMMISRKLVFKKKYQEDAKILNAIAKYPPAFGLLGASTGMIAMMTNLGTGGTDKIGGAMAIALVATFWGIAATNFIILPLADYAQRAIQVDQGIRDFIIEGVMMMRRGESDADLTDLLKSKLDLSDRILIKAGSDYGRGVSSTGPSHEATVVAEVGSMDPRAFPPSASRSANKNK